MCDCSWLDVCMCVWGGGGGCFCAFSPPHRCNGFLMTQLSPGAPRFLNDPIKPCDSWEERQQHPHHPPPRMPQCSPRGSRLMRNRENTSLSGWHTGPWGLPWLSTATTNGHRARNRNPVGDHAGVSCFMNRQWDIRTKNTL